MRDSIKVRGSVALDCDHFGDKDLPLLLLISGAGAPAEFWPETFCSRLAGRGLYVVRYCHRDTGSSTHFPEPYGIDELLEDLKGLIDSLDRPAVHLAGHSMGGYLAQMAAVRFPEIIASVSSISAGSSVTPEICSELGMSSVTEETWQKLMQNDPGGDFDDDLPGWLEVWRFLNGTLEFDEGSAIEYTKSLYRGYPDNFRVATNHVHAMTTVPAALASEIKAVRCPFLVIHGTDDPLVPLDNGEATARLVTHSRICRLEGAGHMFFNRGVWDEILLCLASHAGSSP